MTDTCALDATPCGSGSGLSAFRVIARKHRGGYGSYRHDLTGRGNYGWKADGLLGTLYINCAALNAKKANKFHRSRAA